MLDTLKISTANTWSFSEEQKAVIQTLVIPTTLNILSAGSFETKNIETKNSIWRINASGETFNLNFSANASFSNLLKFLCYRYAVKNSVSHMDEFLSILRRSLESLPDFSAIAFLMKLEQLGSHSDESSAKEFYILLFSLKQLIAYNFPSFKDDYDFKIELLPRPQKDRFLIYQDIDNILTVSETTLIQNGLVKSASEVASLSDNELQDVCILGLCYSTGARPVQLSKLSPEHLKLDFGTDKNTAKYSIRMPLAKQSKSSIDKFILIKISEELAQLLSVYIERMRFAPETQLFKSHNTVQMVNDAIKRSLKFLSPLETQNLINSGELIPPALTSTDFRHNLGHTLAMRGASAEEIAYILGHSSTVAARHYILATPELADVKARTLGINPVYQDIIAMMMTGEITKHGRWNSDIVAGTVNNHFHVGIGGCAKDGAPCHLSPVRACYGCQDFHPFADANHVAVLNDVQLEMESLATLSDSTGNTRSPIIAIHEQTKFEVISVIARCQLYKDGENERNNQQSE